MNSIEIKLHLAGQKIVERLKNDIKNKKVTPFGSVNASGQLADSVRYEATPERLTVYALDYIYYLEVGRKPGKRPPISAVKKWIDDKKINPTGITKDSLAFLIARKIGLKGTTIYQQGGSDLIKGILDSEFFEDIKRELALGVIDEIRSEIIKV